MQYYGREQLGDTWITKPNHFTRMCWYIVWCVWPFLCPIISRLVFMELCESLQLMWFSLILRLGHSVFPHLFVFQRILLLLEQTVFRSTEMGEGV